MMTIAQSSIQANFLSQFSLGPMLQCHNSHSVNTTVSMTVCMYTGLICTWESAADFLLRIKALCKDMMALMLFGAHVRAHPRPKMWY